MNRAADLQQLVHRLAREAGASDQRRVLVLTGRAEWCREAARHCLDALAPGSRLWVSAAAPPGEQALAPAQARKSLGREVGALVFDAHSGFDPDAFGAASGTVRGGGLLLLLAPPLAEWPGFADPERARIAVAPYTPEQVGGRFLARLVRVLQEAPGVVIAGEDGRCEDPQPIPDHHAPPVGSRPPPPYRTEDQRRAVEAIEGLATAAVPRPVVLTSDRGRGKSAALGIAAGRLLQSGTGRILVTAPRLAACEALFEHAARVLPEAVVRRGKIRLGTARIDFVPPDALGLEAHRADLVLVDEAAAIPAPMLERILERHPRIAFATTVHGYEGTGRGFALRFHRTLDTRAPGWRALRLETPVRWAPGDPLERLVYRALLLDAAPAPNACATSVQAADARIERLDRDRLAGEEATLSELFGLLVLAHYRTRPYDLRHLLDGPNLGVYVMRAGAHVVATALVAEEGGIEPAIGRAVFEGRRRLRGHLIPQSLAAHGAWPRAPALHYARIMRIAVHPAAQGRGLGSRLLEAVVGDAEARGCDLVGASFGATPQLLRFWGQGGFLPARLGFTREHTSGSHSVIVLRPVSPAGDALLTAARERLAADLQQLRNDLWREVDAQVIAVLGVPERPPKDASAARDAPLGAGEREEVEAFAFAQRGYEASLVPLRRLVGRALAGARPPAVLTEMQRRALQLRVLEGCNWAQTAAALGASGRGEVLGLLRAGVGALLRGGHNGESEA